MTATIINGKEIAAQLRQEIAVEVSKIRSQTGHVPGLAVILLGNDPASEVYVANKERAAHAVGMNSLQYRLDANTSEEELIAKIRELNADRAVHGILVQLPLPKHIDTKKVIHEIDYRKDVDGFNIINVGKLSVGDITGDNPAIVPCTPLGSLHLIKTVAPSLAGMKALVIGSSNIVGKPLSRLLMLENCTVTVANSSTRDLKAECLQADIIVSAAGVPNLVKSDMVKKDAIVIDVGINRVNIYGQKPKAGENLPTHLVGDIDFASVKEIAKAITPVPGGVGPMTIAYLLRNTLNCYSLLNKNSNN